MESHNDLEELCSVDHLNILMKTSLSGLPNGAENVTGNALQLQQQHSHQLVSTNSFELNGASLSEDSGLPHTNSSISSGDSLRVGLCRFEFELAESDGEVSQFDSLDNCSDGGMSAENFNTLKKGPLAPIDPPPEFQDSPQTTLLRSPVLQTYAVKLSKNLINNAMKIYATQNLLETLKTTSNYSLKTSTISNIDSQQRTKPSGSAMQLRSYELYASDSFINRQPDNIYDIPNADMDHSEFMTSKRNTSLDHHRQNQPAASRTCEIYDYDIYYNKKHSDSFQRRKTPVLYSPLHYHPGSNLSTNNRPNSRNSLSSRLSSSHNSLSVITTNKADDSIFITQAMSHDALTGREISDFYNVPIDSDMYALPVDVIQPELKEIKTNAYRNLRGKLKYVRNNKKRRKTTGGSSNGGIEELASGTTEKYGSRVKSSTSSKSDKRHSVPENMIEPMHMTLDEVKRFYHSLYTSSSDSSDVPDKRWTLHNKRNVAPIGNHSAENPSAKSTISPNNNNNNINSHNNNNSNKCVSVKVINKTTGCYKNKKFSTKDNNCANSNNGISANNGNVTSSVSVGKKSQFSINLNLKQKFCSIFRFRKTHHATVATGDSIEYDNNRLSDVAGSDVKQDKKVKFSTRALPPLPSKGVPVAEPVDPKGDKKPEESTMDFAANIEKVKEYGWYWGPISSEAAEKILSNEPDGSFIVRDSSDDHYIFSLTFKLNNSVRHVRIEQDQGTFSFGSCAKFKSHTIMEFIENAVESSRSGRYLFFFHRRPEHGPMRVQLTNPVSRFRHIQSLQHMCRFVIRKTVVRKDLIQSLPLPRRLLDYLSYKNCYSEQVESDSSHSQVSDDGQSIAN